MGREIASSRSALLAMTEKAMTEGAMIVGNEE